MLKIIPGIFSSDMKKETYSKSLIFCPIYRFLVTEYIFEAVYYKNFNVIPEELIEVRRQTVGSRRFSVF
jgi:hypothetical protein